MKFIDHHLATLATIMSFVGCALAVSCLSLAFQPTTTTLDVLDLYSNLLNNGQNYRVSGPESSQFYQIGTAKLTMIRNHDVPATGSTHVAAKDVAATVLKIIQQCCNTDRCCGNEDMKGDQGDNVNVNIVC